MLDSLLEERNWWFGELLVVEAETYNHERVAPTVR